MKCDVCSKHVSEFRAYFHPKLMFICHKCIEKQEEVDRYWKNHNRKKQYILNHTLDRDERMNKIEELIKTIPKKYGG